MRLLPFTSPAFPSLDELVVTSLIMIWLLAVAAVAALAICRWALNWHDHMTLTAHPAHAEFEHLKTRGRIGAVDRWGKALTIVVVTQGVGLILFVTYRIFREGIRVLEQLLKLW